MSPFELLRWSCAGLLLAAAWLLPRKVAGTGLRMTAALPADLLLPVGLFALALTLSSRPLLAGIVTLAAGAGWARADLDKRRVLREPIVFTDLFQAFDILRHPDLALPFPHKGLIVLGSLAVVAFFALVVHYEPAAHSLPGPLLLLACMAGLLLGIRHFPDRIAQQFSADPAADAAHHGPFATILLHALFAHRQRIRLHERVRAEPLASSGSSPCSGPVVLIQSESFFDIRRLHPDIPGDLLPNFDRCRRAARLHGRLTVPCWGANTVRTEFAVLTGLGAAELGFDRFNPYARFVTASVRSLAWELKQRGYRTVCLHPFDPRFYRRDEVMPLLGFDEFIGEEAFADAERINGYVSDRAVMQAAIRLIREHGPKLFLFVITMENHGPWSSPADTAEAALPPLPIPETERGALQHYAQSLRHADAMLGQLCAALAGAGGDAVLGFYGDHWPSFPALYAALGVGDARSDYLIWRSQASGEAKQCDIAASDLAAALLRVHREVSEPSERFSNQQGAAVDGRGTPE